MEKNKTGKYLKYAIGEILLVVIGILIALSINNWNESRKLEQKKHELIINLIDDFEENIDQLKPAIEYSDSLSYKINTFFENAYKPNINISLDSLKILNDGFFRPTNFFASMVTFDEAKSSGKLTLIKSKDLSEQFVEFQRNYNNYLDIQNQAVISFFSGPVWELKKVIGSLSILSGKKSEYINIDIDMDSYIKLINTPLVTATLENQNELNRNTNYALKRMDLTSKKIVEILYELNK